MSMRVYDYEQGKWVIVPDNEVQAGIVAGKYGARKGVEIPVTKEGENFTVPSEQLREALGKGFQLRQAKESAQIKKEAQMEVAAEMPVTAFAKNTLSAATFGGSDVALAGLGADREFAQTVDEANPISTMGGQVTGGIIGAVSAPGVALSAKAASLGAKVATGSAPVLGKFAGNVAGQMSNYGAEGLAYGFGQAISEAALGDPNEIASSIVYGGGLGAAMGGAVGTAAPIAKAVYSKMLDIAEKTAIKTSESVLPALATRAVEVTAGKEAAEQFGQIVTKRTEDGQLAVKGLMSAESAAEREAVEQGSKQFIKDTTDATTELKNSIKNDINTVRQELFDNADVYADKAAQLRVQREQLLENIKGAKGAEKAAFRQQRAELELEIAQLSESRKASKAKMREKSEAELSIENTLNDLDTSLDNDAESIFGSLQRHRDALDFQQKALYTEAENGLKGITLQPAQREAATNYLIGLKDAVGALDGAAATSAKSVGKTIDNLLTGIKDTNILMSDDDLIRGIVQTRRSLRDSINWRSKKVDSYELPLRGMYDDTNKILDSMTDTVPQLGALRTADAAYSTVYKLNKTMQEHKQINRVMKLGKSVDTNDQRVSKNLAQNIVKDPEYVKEVEDVLLNHVVPATEAVDKTMVANVDDIMASLERVKNTQAQRQEASAKLLDAQGRPQVIPEDQEIAAAMAKLKELQKAGIKDVNVDDLKLNQALNYDIKMNEAVKASLRQRAIKLKGMSIEEAAEYVTDIANPGLGDKLEHFRKLKGAIQHIKSSPMNLLEKDLYLRKTLTPDSDAIGIIEKTLKDNNDLSFIQQFRRQEGVPASSILSAGALFSGNPATALMTMTIGKAVEMARSPYGAIAALPVIESAARSGRRAMDAIGAKLGNALTSKPVARSVLSISNESKNYSERKKIVEENSDPGVFMDRNAAALDSLSGAPNVQFALMNKMQAAQQYLQLHMPKDPLASQYINPAQSKWKPTAQEMAKFNRIFEAVSNPAAAFEKFSDGVITTEEATALKVVHPEIYLKMQEITVKTLIEMKKPVDYQKRVNLGIMFGIPTDPTLVPEYINGTQNMINQYGKEDKKPTSNLKIEPETLLSDNQRISMR